ncbi:tRNA pseudouridine(38-40) synthase TruA [Methanofollis aquaemaris]|uniref:tRNA pseudouridine synthase A n=1 Tax=Methanofollis aquaemaris TaxID=126734 RepID=A0A8A3S5A4_9EURY|nr:tRNA pseudouridine(38-40) synthase TruA [Methanofollis aquaemaris]QSZ67315.1 tRNA pseudouridine(38-40) synthase TruA [Methanofollis aquaemaris]
MRLAFRIGYWGDEFFGSQVQPEVRTVEGDVAEVCRRLGLFDDPREARFSFAGRTDRGVHAAGQVCAFTTAEPERAVAALRYELPADIWTTGWAEVDDWFSPRKEATARTYRYFFDEHPGDTALMDLAAEAFLGEHDFTLLSRRSERNPVRRVHAARVFDEDDFCVFEVTAESFLWNMVRCMASALAAVGRGDENPGWIEEILRGEGERRLPAAPSGGLILADVAYPFPFTPLPPSPKAERALIRREREFTLKKRVSATLHGLSLDLPGEEQVDDELRDLP